MKLGELPDIPYKDVIEGPTTRFYANNDETAIIVEQSYNNDVQKVELTKRMIELLPEMAGRWIKK